jgi:steroid delta-isomerase-like uncharacterized protein
MGLEENKAIARRFVECFGTGDLSRLEDFIAPDCHLHGPGTPSETGKGPERFRETVLRYRGAFPDIHLAIDDQIAEGDKVVIAWHAEGTMKGELLGMQPTGKHGQTTAVHIFRISNGKIHDARIEWDMLGLLQQMGIVPTSRPAERKAA